MAKRNKKEVRMIDMSARMKVEIIPATEDELEQAKKELEELNQNIEEKMKKYSSNLSKRIIDCLKDNEQDMDDKDAAYFLEKYQIMLNRSTSNVQDKIDQYEEILQKVRKNTN